MIARILIIGFFFVCSEVIFAQTDSSWTFNDSNGNILTIENTANLPDNLDVLIFRSDKIVEQIVDSTRQWKISIIDIKRIKKNRTYDLKLIKMPLNASVEDALKHKGYFHYECKIRKSKNEITEVVWIKYSHGEI